MRRRLFVLAAATLAAACSLGGMKPGYTRDGAVFDVPAPTAAEARRSALTAALGLFSAPGSISAATTDRFAARAFEFVGKERYKKGKGLVELRFARLMSALDKEGLLRPVGFSAREPRVLLLVSEPAVLLDLGVGPTADAMRRGLSSYGMAAIDGRDALNGFVSKNNDRAALAVGAARLGADWMLVAAAETRAELDPGAGMWRGRASLVVDQYRIDSATPIAQLRSQSVVIDVSSSSARVKALEQVGEDASAKAAAEITHALGGRSEGALFVSGRPDPARLKSFLAAVRGVEGVAGAYLGQWKAEDDALIVRVFMTALKIDGLAARLLRLNPELTLLSIEPEVGRLSVELPGPRDKEEP